MEENELETRLFHLGQDVGYMGLRIQKEVQKCIKDLKVTHDNKTFCEKLADILKKFSEYTGQYAKDLESRVKDFNKEDEYREITNKLREITCINCKNEVVSSVNDSEQPNINDDVQKTEIISQTSLHIDGDDLKSEQSIQDQSTANLDELIDGFDQIQEPPNSTQQQSKESPSTVPHNKNDNCDVDSEINQTNVEVLEEEVNNFNSTEIQEDHSSIANSLDISHSEEVLIEDQNNLDSEIPNTQNKDNDSVVETVNIDSVEVPAESATKSSDEILVKSVIALPHAPIGEEASNTIQKVDVIALPYEPLCKNVRSDAVADSESSNNKEDQAIIDVADDSSLQNKEANNAASICDNGYDSDVEIVSVLPSKEQNSSDGSDQNTIINSQIDINEAALEISDDSDVEFVEPSTSQIGDDKRPKPTSKRGRSSHIDESEDSDFEHPIVDRSPRRYSSHNVEPDLETGDTKIDSDVATGEDNTEVSKDDVAVVNDGKTDELDAETEAIDAEQANDVADHISGKDTQDDSSEKETENEELPGLEDPVEENLGSTKGDTTTQEGSFHSQATVCDFDSEPQNSESSSDATTIRSKADQAVLNHDEENSVVDDSETQSSVDFSLETDIVPPKVVGDEEYDSNSDDSIYLKKTQKIPIPTPISNVESHFDVAGDEETQVAVPVSAGAHDTNHSNDSLGVDDIVVDKSQCKESGEINSNTDLIDSTEGADADGVGEMEEKGCSDEMTQEIEISSTSNDNTLVDASDVTMKNCDDVASQESYVFDLEKDILDTEVQSPSNSNKSADDDNSTVTVEKSVPSPKNDNEEKNSPENAETQSAGTLSISELENGENVAHSGASSVLGEISESDIQNEESSSPKRKINLKEKDRKSLLKVIAQFYLKKKQEKVEAAKKEKEESKKSDDKKSKKSPNKKAEKKLSEEGKKRKARSKKSDKVAKDYLDFVEESRIDENSKSSVESNRDDVDIQEDKSNSSDMDATQIENFDNKNGEINDIQEKGDEISNKDVGDKESNSKNSSDSEDLFGDSSEKEAKDSKEATTLEETNQTFSELLDTLCLKPLEPNCSEKNKDLDDSRNKEDPDLTQKIDDIRKLRQTNSEKSCAEENVFTSPEDGLSHSETEYDPDLTQKVDDIRKLRHTSSIEENVKGNKIDEDQNNELSDENETQVVSPHKKKLVRPLTVTQSDNEDALGERGDDLGERGDDLGERGDDLGERSDENESQVVSPHKKKFVRSLPVTQSDGEDVAGSPEDGLTPETDNDEIVVSPHKKKGVKRLLSSDESDVEPQKRSLEESDSDDIVRPLKRGAAKRLLSTASEADQKASDGDDSDINPTSKKRKTTKDSDEEMDPEHSDIVQPSQFRLDDRARDDLLDLFNEPKEEGSGSSEKGSCDVVSSASERDENRDDEVPVAATQFKLDDCDRDNLLNLLTDRENEEKSDGSDETLKESKAEIKASKETGKVSDDDDDEMDEAIEEFKAKIKANNETGKVSDVATEDDEDDTFSESNQFKLNSSDRDELLDLLNDGSDAQNESSSGKTSMQPPPDEKPKKVDPDESIEPSQFKLDDRGRDDLLSMLSSDQGEQEGKSDMGEDNSKEEGNDGDGGSKIGSDDVDNDNDNDRVMDALLNIEGDRDKDDGDDGDDKIDEDSSPENSQGIDDSDDMPEDDENIEETKSDEEIDGDQTIEENDQKSGTKNIKFQLDESDKDDLLSLLNDYIEKREESESEESDPEGEKDEEEKKEKKKSKKIDKDTLLELVKEYENILVEGKDNELVENVINGGDMEVGNMMGMESDNEMLPGSNYCAGSDAESVLLDLLREEAVNQDEKAAPKRGRKKSMNTNKAAWEAYKLLLKESDDISGESSETSDTDGDISELDFSDQERKQKDQKVFEKLLKKYKITKELVVDVEQADISGFDVEIQSKREENVSDKVDRLCDLSNVLHKRKYRRKHALPRTKRPKLSPRLKHAHSDDDSSSASSFDSALSSEDDDDSVRANWDAASKRDSSPLRLSLGDDDDNAEQDRLANALWEDIKNSTDDEEAASSCEAEGDSSDDDEMMGRRKKKKKSGGGGGGKKIKKVESEEEKRSGSEEESEREEGKSDSGKDSDLNGKEEKIAGLDSSDEEDFVGVRKMRGAWRHDPLLKGCLTSDDDSDFESDEGSGADEKGATKKLVRSCRLRKGKRKMLISENDEDKTPVKDDGGSSDSDIEFIMEKKKTPKKPDSPEQEEDDTPSKMGKGRRNIRALVEDDELAESTKRANKEETERIRRLQQREKAKEIFTQSQSLGSSQLSEDEVDPLILDVHDDFQIKVHPKITKKLKPHQRKGIQFMWDSCYESVEQLKKDYSGSGCILAHCMGLGKTLQALGLIHTLFNYKETKTKHVLVVCPLSTVSNWRNEYKLAYKDIRGSNIKIYTIENKKAGAERFSIVEKWHSSGGVLVMGYECFGLMTNDDKLDKQPLRDKDKVKRALVKPGPDLIICDEGHLLRNKQTQRTLALNKVATRRRIVLTGTPLQNNLIEYYYMVNFVKPNLLGTEKEYKTNFVNPIQNGQFENSTATDILFMKQRTHVLHKILAKTVQRVEDTELKQYLPDLVDQALFLKLSDLQVNFYNTYLDSANDRPVTYTRAGNICRKNFLADVQILRYICTHPDIVTIAKKSGKSKKREQDVIDDTDDAIEDKVFSRGDWYRQILPVDGVKKPELGTKMMVALGIVEEAVASNDKTLIFSQSHAEMDSLEYFLQNMLNFKKGVDYNRMDGTISPEVRTHMCDKFNNPNSKKLRVFLMSTQVGGLGLNLTAANRVVIMNVHWNPSYDTQSVFRAFRFGQNKAVYVYRLIAKDTMEEKMYQRQVTKLAVAHRVVDKHQITRHYSAADIQEFYSVRPTIAADRPLPNVPEDRVLAKLIQKFQFVYKWHEHQALLANRPEEDLDEHQKNAAWEQFNRRADEPPPPIPPPGMTPGTMPPQFRTATDILNQPGPSGLQMQNRILAARFPLPGATQTTPKKKATRPKKAPVSPVVAPLQQAHIIEAPKKTKARPKKDPVSPVVAPLQQAHIIEEPKKTKARPKKDPVDPVVNPLQQTHFIQEPKKTKARPKKDPVYPVVNPLEQAHFIQEPKKTKARPKKDPVYPVVNPLQQAHFIQAYRSSDSSTRSTRTSPNLVPTYKPVLKPWQEANKHLDRNVPASRPNRPIATAASIPRNTGEMGNGTKLVPRAHVASTWQTVNQHANRNLPAQAVPALIPVSIRQTPVRPTLLNTALQLGVAGAAASKNAINRNTPPLYVVVPGGSSPSTSGLIPAGNKSGLEEKIVKNTRSKVRERRIEEINSIVSESLSQEWDKDGMNTTLMSIDVPSDSD